ncbi:hypothetical protein CLOM_g245 [Closterium sp. NIES-68]|nr:hypothetical protein CLOM_g245 [Closterium sp. NIES-68]GJP86342.1 hypothetical protein CLOP_g16374 [Closterium sp. NIES-67]
MFTSTPSLSHGSAPAMASAAEPTLCLGVPHGIDLLGSSVPASVDDRDDDVDDLTEEDVWFPGDVDNSPAVRSTQADAARPLAVESVGRSFVPSAAEPLFPLSGRTVTRGPADAVPAIFNSRDGSSSRPLGLSLVPTLVEPNSGDSIRVPNIGGDIIKGPSAALPTSSVLIPRPLPSPHDAIRPMRRASAPIHIPCWSKSSAPRDLPAAGPGRTALRGEEQQEEDEIIPPHEIVARQYAQSVNFSVTEGVGRALRGRDLAHVRTEILRKTGFFE